MDASVGHDVAREDSEPRPAALEEQPVAGTLQRRGPGDQAHVGDDGEHQHDDFTPADPHAAHTPTTSVDTMSSGVPSTANARLDCAPMNFSTGATA